MYFYSALKPEPFLPCAIGGFKQVADYISVYIYIYICISISISIYTKIFKKNIKDKFNNKNCIEFVNSLRWSCYNENYEKMEQR